MITINNKKILIKLGNIVEETSDAIVNASNPNLRLGSGVSGAINAAGGPTIQDLMYNILSRIETLPATKAVITEAGELPCKFIIHASGPISLNGIRGKKASEEERTLLEQCIWNILTLADLYNLKTISMPAISSGVFGFPKNECAEILLSITMDFLLVNENSSLEEIIMCNFDEETYNIFLDKAIELNELYEAYIALDKEHKEELKAKEITKIIPKGVSKNKKNNLMFLKDYKNNER